MKGVSSSPKIITLTVVIVLLVQLTVLVESGKIMEKSKRYPNKETRCPEGKDGAPCRKSARQEVIPGMEKPSPTSGEVAIVPPRRPSSFIKRFEHCMQFAERTVVQLSRELLGFYGVDRNGWEMDMVELILKTVAKDMVQIIKSIQF